MKHVLITGSTSGIGFALAEALAKHGYFVWAGARNPSSLESLAKKYPQRLRPIKLDVTKKEDIDSAYQEISSQADLRDFYLVNNAGLALGSPFESMPLAEWQALFDVNVFGLIQTTQVFLPLLRKSKGRIINIGSISGRVSTPYLSPYTSSKFAVRAITDSLRVELAPQKISVVLIEAGSIKTEIWQKSADKSKSLSKNIAEHLLPIYQQDIGRLTRQVEKIARTAMPIEIFTERLVKAITAAKPKPYYLIGKGVHLQMLLVWLLPTKILDRLLRQNLGR
jgi:NAD(P)-dependent dehydrogenase (short-subunit alcohol dehydrogenase family)